MLVFSIVVLVLACQISGICETCAPGTFPMAAAAVMVISMVAVLVENRKLQKPNTTGWRDEMHRAANRMLPGIIVGYVGIILAYMLLILPIHFFPSSFIFLFVSMIYLRGTSWFRSLLISCGALIGIYIIFKFAFRVVLP